MGAPAILPVIQWQPVGPQKETRSILRGETKFFGLPYIAIAIEVENHERPEFGNPYQKGKSSAADAELIRWQRAADALGCFQTFSIEGRSYAIFLRPQAG